MQVSRVRCNSIRTNLQDDNSRRLQAFARLHDRSANRHQFLILFGTPRRRRLILLHSALSRLCVNAPSNCLMLQTVEYDFLLYYSRFDRYNIVQLRASYRIVDHRERQIAPHSLVFSLTAQKLVLREYLNVSFLIMFHPRLYCGFEDAIELFDLSRPGEGTRLHTTPSKKSKDGLKGRLFRLIFFRDLTLARRDHLCHCILTLV
jgi:hypothetical protein